MNEYVIDIQGLEKTYKNGLVALHGIDLRIAKGDFFALLGPNGAGKSTTIGILSGLVRKNAGSVCIAGYDIDTATNQAKSMLGIVPQEVNFSLFEKCIDIVVNQGGYYGMRRRDAQKNAEKYMKLLQLWEKRNEMTRQLSGGMKRRLMIARALVHEPRVLILDEPTAGVDVELRRSTWDFLTRINKEGVTVLLTTHYLEEAERLCRNIAIIDQGKIIVNAPMKEVLSAVSKETMVLELSRSIATLSLDSDEYHPHLVDDTTIEIELDKGQNLNRLFAELNNYDIEVKSIRSKSNRLEELFLSLVVNKGEK